MWVYTNSPTWELIGNNTPTWKRIGTVTWVYTNTLTRELNRYRPDRTRPDQTGPDRHTLNLSRIENRGVVQEYTKAGICSVWRVFSKRFFLLSFDTAHRRRQDPCNK
jgi:hypothetical protein